jgi:hypothetical protein
MSFRIAPLLRQRLFATSSRVGTSIPMEHAAAAQLSATASAVPKIGRIARWYGFQHSGILRNTDKVQGTYQPWHLLPLV